MAWLLLLIAKVFPLEAPMQRGSRSKPIVVPCGAGPASFRANRRTANGQGFLDWALAAIIFAAAGVLGISIRPTYAENAEISLRRTAERLSFSDGEIADGFFKVAFGAELQFDKPVKRIRKFDEPVRVFVDSRTRVNRSVEIAAVVADIRAHVARLDIAVTGDRKAANVIVTIVNERDMGRTLRARFGQGKTKKIMRSLDPVCLSGIGKDETYRIRRAEVFLPADAGEFTFYDCAYEELLQALGPINDTASVPWTMFNDEVQMGFFDRYDQYLLNILYDPRIAPGMSVEEVARLLPQVLPDVRARVANGNAQGHPRPSSNAEAAASRS